MILSNRSNVDLFFIRLKHGCISNEKKKLLYDLVNSLENRTDLQKERFILIYNLKADSNIKYTFSSLGRKSNCSNNAIRYSIASIRNSLVNLKDERKEIFLKIIQDDD